MPPIRNTNHQKLPEQEDRMRLAIQALEKKEITSLSEASRRFDVPRSTLSGRTKGAIHRPYARANSRKLTATEEESLLQWIISEEKRGLVPLQSRVREMANYLLANRFFDDDSVTVGINWAHNFIKRTKVLRQQSTDDPLPDPGQRLKQIVKAMPQLVKILEQVEKKSNKVFSDLNLSKAEAQSQLKSIRRKNQCPSNPPVDLMQQNQQLAKILELAKCSLAEDQTLSKSARNKQQRSYDRADALIQHTQRFAEGFQQILSQLQCIVAEEQLRDAENARSALEEQEQEQIAPDSQLPEEDMLARQQLEGKLIWRRLRQLRKPIAGQDNGNLVANAANQGINVIDARLIVMMVVNKTIDNGWRWNYLHECSG